MALPNKRPPMQLGVQPRVQPPMQLGVPPPAPPPAPPPMPPVAPYVPGITQVVDSNGSLIQCVSRANTLPELLFGGYSDALNYLTGNQRPLRVIDLRTNESREKNPLVHSDIVLFPLVDSTANSIPASTFKAVFDILHAAKTDGVPVVILCDCGISRSATVVIAALVYFKYFDSFNAAWEYVKLRRFIIEPNILFVLQIKFLFDTRVDTRVDGPITGGAYSYKFPNFDNELAKEAECGDLP